MAATLVTLVTLALLASPARALQLPGPSFVRGFWPLFSASLSGQAHRAATELMQTYGENYVVRFPAPWSRWAFLNAPETIEELLTVVNPPKSDEFVRGIDAVTKGSMLTSPWEEWLVQRRTVAPALSPKLVGSWTAIFEECAAPLFASLEAAAATPGAEVEMDGAFVRVYLAIISRITLGRRLTDAQAAELTGCISDVLDESMRRIVLPSSLRLVTAVLPVGRRYRRASRGMDALIASAVDERRAARAARAAAGDADASGGDLLDLLLDAQADGAMSAQQVKAQLLTFILAGHDTTAHTLSWLLFEVARQPELQRRLHAEADAALPARNGFPAARDLQKLPLLDRVFKEALRKHPVAATGTLRKLTADCELAGGAPGAPRFALRRGAVVSVVPFSTHRNARAWGAPVERFDPDRFLPEPSAARHAFAYQPFSGGPRDCIGKGLARAEALSVLVVLFRRFEFELAGDAAAAAAAGAEPRDHHMITRKPVDGIAVRVRAR